MLNIAAVLDLEIYILDIGNAFLETNLDKPIIMAPPDDLVKLLGIKNDLLQIVKGLYGLKQAGYLWYNHLKMLLIEFGFTISEYDQCVFVYQQSNSVMYLLVYVDDMLLVSKCTIQMEKFLAYLESKLTKVKTIKESISFRFLGIHITRDRADHTISLDQIEYAQKFLSQFLNQSVPRTTFPIEVDNILNDPEQDKTNQPNWDIIGRIRYLVDRSRPDLLYPVSVLSRYMTAPTDAVVAETNRLLRYIESTVSHKLHLGGESLGIVCMTDASFTHKDEGRSHLGYAIFLSPNSGSVSSYSKRADSVALSSTQSETDALVEALKEISWISGLINSLGITIPKPHLVLVDNQPVVALANDGNHTKRSRLFIIKTHFVKEQREKGNITIHHIKGVDNHADILTKGLKGSLLTFHTAGLLGHYLKGDQQDPTFTSTKIKIDEKM